VTLALDTVRLEVVPRIVSPQPVSKSEASVPEALNTADLMFWICLGLSFGSAILEAHVLFDDHDDEDWGEVHFNHHLHTALLKSEHPTDDI
jgi:hypothetical protein